MEKIRNAGKTQGILPRLEYGHPDAASVFLRTLVVYCRLRSLSWQIFAVIFSLKCEISKFMVQNLSKRTQIICNFFLLFFRAVSPSGATYLITMVSVSVNG